MAVDWRSGKTQGDAGRQGDRSGGGRGYRGSLGWSNKSSE